MKSEVELNFGGLTPIQSAAPSLCRMESQQSDLLELNAKNIASNVTGQPISQLEIEYTGIQVNKSSSNKLPAQSNFYTSRMSPDKREEFNEMQRMTIRAVKMERIREEQAKSRERIKGNSRVQHGKPFFMRSKSPDLFQKTSYLPYIHDPPDPNPIQKEYEKIVEGGWRWGRSTLRVFEDCKTDRGQSASPFALAKLYVGVGTGKLLKQIKNVEFSAIKMDSTSSDPVEQGSSFEAKNSIAQQIKKQGVKGNFQQQLHHFQKQLQKHQNEIHKVQKKQSEQSFRSNSSRGGNNRNDSKEPNPGEFYITHVPVSTKGNTNHIRKPQQFK